MANTLKLGAGKWATGTDTVLAFNDENNNFKPLPFDFSRASSATVVNQSGLIETVGSGTPRIDFKDNAKGALLLEPTRSNALLQSNQFDTTWVIGASALNLTSGQSGIYGSNNAWLLKKNTSGARFLQQTLSLSSAKYTYSVYLKAESTNFALIWTYNGSTDAETYFDLANGVIGDSTGNNLNNAKIESVGNGWYRCTLTYTQSTTLVRIYPAYSNENVSTGTDSGIYIQHAQLEVGSYPTSIIPTSGSAVTRVADSCNQTPPSGVIGQTEGVIYVESNNLLPSGTRSIAVAYTSGSSFYQIYLTSTNQIRVDISGSLLILSNSININILNKIAFAYKSGENALYVNGVLMGSSVSTTVPSSLNDFYLGNLLGNEQSGSYQDLKLYNTRLSNAELQALTTI